MNELFEHIYLDLVSDLTRYFRALFISILLAVISYLLLRAANPSSRILRAVCLCVLLCSGTGVGLLLYGMRTHGLGQDLQFQRAAARNHQEQVDIANGWRAALGGIKVGVTIRAGTINGVNALHSRDGKTFLLAGSITPTLADDHQPIGIAELKGTALDTSLSERLVPSDLAGFAYGMRSNSKGNLVLSGRFLWKGKEVCAVEIDSSGAVRNALQRSALASPWSSNPFESCAFAELEVLQDDSILLIIRNSNQEVSVTHASGDGRVLAQKVVAPELQPSRQPNEAFRWLLTPDALVVYSQQRAIFFSLPELKERTIRFEEHIPGFRKLHYAQVPCADEQCGTPGCPSKLEGSSLLAIAPHKQKLFFFVEEHSLSTELVKLQTGWLTGGGQFARLSEIPLMTCNSTVVRMSEHDQRDNLLFAGQISISTEERKCLPLTLWKINDTGALDLEFSSAASKTVSAALESDIATVERVSEIASGKLLIVATAPDSNPPPNLFGITTKTMLLSVDGHTGSAL